MSSYEYDVVVIGSGPGGYVAAIRAGQLGMKTAVVEKDPYFGGTCLHRGCIPTKALLHTANLLDEIREAENFGIRVAPPQLDMAAAMDRKRQVVDKNAKGVEFLFRKNKVESVLGLGTVVGAHTVEITHDGASRTIKARNIVLATGSVPMDIPPAPTDGSHILNSDHILNLETVPESLVVLGAGAVGSEFASIYRSFGAQVTLVEALPRLLHIEDEEISKELARSFKKRGIKVKTGTLLKSADVRNGRVHMILQKGERVEELEAEKLLVAVGRRPVTAVLGLEKLGLEMDRDFVLVNSWMQTTVPNIYAIGDIVKTPALAHTASAEGILAVEHIAGLATHPLDYNLTPSATYSEPEVGRVGLTEAQAREQGYEVAIGKFPFSALGKANIVGKPAGFVKIVRDTKYDEILGVHIIGVHATDLIAEACVAMKAEATVEELMRTVHAHPTLSEAVMEAAHAAIGHAIHL